MSDNNENMYAAHSIAGGFLENVTLKEARDQVEAWESKGYSSYVGHMHDPEWEDVKVVAPITPMQVVDSLGADRVALEDFVVQMVELLDWKVDHQDDGFIVYTSEAD